MACQVAYGTCFIFGLEAKFEQSVAVEKHEPFGYFGQVLGETTEAAIVLSRSSGTHTCISDTAMSIPVA